MEGNTLSPLLESSYVKKIKAGDDDDDDDDDKIGSRTKCFRDVIIRSPTVLMK